MKISIEREYKNRGRFLGWGSSPHADWKVMFSLFLILAFLATLFSWRLFVNTRDSLQTPSIIEGVRPIDEKNLRSVSDFYTKQKLELEEARTIPEAITDPSRQ